MIFKKIVESLDITKQCRQYGLTLWQCPSFLFVVLGLIDIAVILIIYFITTAYHVDPSYVAMIVLGIAAVLMVINHLIVKSFDNLARACKAKSEFISIASHQLRTPLTNIKWILSILMKDKNGHISSAELESLRLLQDNNNRMNLLINDLLMATKVDQGKIAANPEKINLGQLVEELVHEYLPFAKANNASLQYEADQTNFSVWADPVHIKLAIRHLIDNSIKYIKGVGWVKVRLLKVKDTIRFEIEDNGIGISKAEQKKIFDKFFRCQNVMRYQTDGTGLGLFITKAIIHNAKGKIGFRSKENLGSTFWFELPACN